MKEQIDEFIAINKPSVNDPGILWEALKGCIRDKTIGFASHLNKSRLQHIQKLEKNISEVENAMTLNVHLSYCLRESYLAKTLIIYLDTEQTSSCIEKGKIIILTVHNLAIC